MKKTLLQEVKAMNKLAGTQMTKQQEINLIRDINYSIYNYIILFVYNIILYNEYFR
jgi:hypothetical protein